MIKAVLLDLDNTLLVNPDHIFAVEFLHLADTHFAHWLPKMSESIRQVLRTLVLPEREPRLTNHKLAMQVIAAAIQRPDTDVLTAFQEFYAQAYDQLRHCIQPVESAPELIAHLRALDLAVVIATNPIYPALAVQKRLAWAGLEADLEAYAFVTHAENMHFAKPDPAYYAEILARVGVEPDEAVMVGDSLRNDVNPAQTLGIYTYHIQSETPLADFFHRVREQQWFENLDPQPHTPAMIVPQYRGNIGALYGFVENINPNHWSQHPDPDEWSISEIVCHLVDSENTVQRPRLARILHEDNPFLVQPRSPLGPGEIKCDQEGLALVDAFARARRQTIDLVQALQSADWERPARHSVFGLTNLLEMAYFTAQHDRLHLNQLCQTLGRCQ